MDTAINVVQQQLEVLKETQNNLVNERIARVESLCHTQEELRIVDGKVYRLERDLKQMYSDREKREEPLRAVGFENCNALKNSNTKSSLAEHRV